MLQGIVTKAQIIGKIFFQDIDIKGFFDNNKEKRIMPQPIIPIHQQEGMPILFGQSMQPEFQLSELQAILLQPTKADKKLTKVSHNYLTALADIDKNTDFIVTAISESSERMCSVPRNVDENTLLSLKAEGLVSGYGRSVKITERGRNVLKDHYLSAQNKLKENRASDKFDFKSFSRVASKGENE